MPRQFAPPVPAGQVPPLHPLAATLPAAVTTKELAEALRLSPEHLRSLRSRGAGPAFVRVGARRVVYTPAAVSAWLHDSAAPVALAR